MTDDAGTESDADDAATDGGPADASDESGTGEQSKSGETDDVNGRNGNGDGAPHVDLSMYQLSVSVRGSDDDELDDVSDAARDLMDYLAAKSVELEERPDDRGLG